MSGDERSFGIISLISDRSRTASSENRMCSVVPTPRVISQNFAHLTEFSSVTLLIEDRTCFGLYREFASGTTHKVNRDSHYQTCL